MTTSNACGLPVRQGEGVVEQQSIDNKSGLMLG